MKKIIVLLSAMLITLSVTAQVDVKFGVKAGLNVSQIGGGTAKMNGQTQDIDASDMLVGFHVGGVAHFNLANLIGLQPEILFSMQGESDGEGSNVVKTTLNFINIPVLLDIKPIPNLSILVGPQLGINVSRSVSRGGISVSGKEFDDSLAESGMKINTLDVAAVVGVQYTFIEHLVVGARYNFGFTPSTGISSVGEAAGLSISGGSHRVIQLSVGWLF